MDRIGGDLVVAGHRRDLDGLRGIAVLAVVVFHGFPHLLPGGYVGVDVFFVISGYLITGILLRDLAAGRFTFREFYIRRARRILPALLIVLCSCAIAGWLLLSAEELRHLSKQIVAGALSVGNVANWHDAGYFDSAGDLKPLQHLWSLGVEEQYYLAWPLAMLVVRGRVRTLIGATIVLSFLANVILIHDRPTATFYLPFTRLWELALGGALAATRELPTRLRNATGLIGAALLVAALLLIDATREFPGWWALLPTIGTTLVIAAGPLAWFGRTVLGARPLVWIGLVSYPLYLWHWPLISFARILSPHGLSPAATVTLMISSLVLAWLVYRWIETPLRRVQRQGRLALFLLFGIAIAALESRAVVQRVIPARTRAVDSLVRDGTARDAALRSGDHEIECDVVAPGVRRACRLAPGPAERTIVLWGDSHAEAWSHVFFEVGRRLGLRVVVIAHHGCAPLLAVRRTDPDAPPTCRDFGLAEEDVKAIADLRPSHIFVTARWSLYAEGWWVHGRLQRETHFLTDAASDSGDASTSQAAIARELPPTVDALARIAPVTLMKTVPVLGSPVEEGRDPDRFEPTIEEHRAHEAFVAALIDAAARRVPGVTILDPATRLCGTRCATVMDGELLYKDDNHLTAQGSLLFEEELVRLLLSARQR